MFDRSIRCLTVLAALGLGLSLAGCAGHARTSASEDAAAPVPAVAAPLQLPASVTPVPQLAPLAFMTGRWIGVNPNKTVNEEHWMSARGNHMIALFRQVRRDGKPAFVEVSLVTADPDGVTLRLRHLHGELQVPAKRTDLSIFKLKEAANDRAEFVGTGDAEEVTSVVYRLVDPTHLAVDVSFAPTSKEKGFTTVYTRDVEMPGASAAAATGATR